VLSALSDAPRLLKGFEGLGLVCAAIGMHEPGGALLATNTIPAPTEDTTGVELASTADGVLPALRSPARSDLPRLM